MSGTPMPTSSPLAVKLYEKKTWIQMMQSATLGHFFNRGCVYFPEELLGTDAKGDQVTFSYASKLTKIPQGEGGTLDGNEEAIDLNSHAMAMNVSRIGTLSPNSNTIEQQRTKVNFSKTSVELVKRRSVELVDTSLWNQLAGVAPSGSVTINGTTYVTAADKLHVQGHNTPVAPTSQRIIRPNARANDQSLVSGDIMALDLVDYALEKISNSDQPIERLAGETYDLYVSPEQLVDLQQNSGAKIKWYDMQYALLAGASKDEMTTERFKNGIVCAGRYRNVFIYEAPRIPNGIRSDTSAVVANTKRAVLVGRDAISFASPFGGRPSDEDVPMKLFSMEKDYGYWKGQEARLMYGLKKMSPSNKQDVGVIVISTYAASHS